MSACHPQTVRERSMLSSKIWRKICVCLLLAQTAAFGAACSDDGVGAGTSNNGTLEPGTELVSFGAASGTTSETGAQASFDVVLAVKPSADVVVKLGSNDPGEGISDVSTLTF